MICQVCEAELDEGASVCETCGAVVGSQDGHTLISTGYARDTVGGPPRGNVLAERYEVVARLSTDVIASRYRALDQETDNSVLLTVLSPDLFRSNRERDEYLQRLEPEIGRGGAYLPGLIDADREGHFVFAVEPFIAGPSLREILDARRSRGESMEPAEVLPVAAQLAAALASVNGTLPHGDVRAERVVVSKEGVRLMGPCILAALPKQVFADALSRHAGWRAVAAPEVMRSGTSTASDRYGAAAIVVEALTRKPPAGVLSVLSGSLARVSDEVQALLSLEPSSRPMTLQPLIDALAKVANVSPPRFDPASFRKPRVLNRMRAMPPAQFTSEPPESESNSFDDEITEERPALAAALASAPKETSGPFPLHDPQTVPEPSRFDSEKPPKEGADTQKYPVLRDSQPPEALPRADSIPSSVGSAIAKHVRQASLAPPPELEPEPSVTAAVSLDEGFDPRLVRAALGITLDDTSSHEMAGFDTIEEHVDPDETQPLAVIEEPARLPPRSRADTPVPPRLRKSALPQTAAERSMSPAPRSPVPPRASGSVPPPPPPRIPNPALLAYSSVNLVDGPPPTGTIITRGAEPTDLVIHDREMDRVTVPPDPNAMTMKPQPGRTSTGVWILGAVLLGVIIVTSAILFRKHRDKEIHEQLLHERFNNTLDAEPR